MTIGFLGAGKMAEALLAGLLKARVARPADVMVCDVLPARRDEVASRYGVRATDAPLEVVTACRIVVLAVKPQDLEALLAGVAARLTRRHLVVSIAAGKNLAWLQARVGSETRLVRVMPNLAVMVGAGMSVFCLGSQATAGDRTWAERLLGCSGRVLELEEPCFDAVTALSGSGPAFFAYLLNALAAAAAGEGLPAAAARLLAEQTMLGAARYLLETGQDPQTFIQAVASPKGTTAAGLAVLDGSTIAAILGDTIRAAAQRSRELSQ